MTPQPETKPEKDSEQSVAAKLLIELGADPTIEDHEQHSTPKGWAMHSHHQVVADYLESVGG